MSSAVGLLEATSAAIGESDNEMAGLYSTRTTSVVDRLITIVADLVWAGTVTITTGDTSEVVVGDWISLTPDDNIFQVSAITPNTDITIENTGFVIPTGSGASQSTKVTLSIPVETVVDWPSDGRVILGDSIYFYTSKTLDPPSLDGLTHTFGGVPAPGIRKLHRIQSTVTDLSQNRSALDSLRRSVFIDFAEGEELNAIGRNLGVNRPPFLGDDDTFREIVKAVAYNPKGTIFGLELALNALVGEGNYEIFEDFFTPVNNTVFIKLLGSAVTDNQSQGKSFVAGLESNPSNVGGTEVPIQEQVVTRGTVGAVILKDENLITVTKAAFPTAQVLTEYVSDPGRTVWSAVSLTETTDTILIAGDGGALEFTNTNNGRYESNATRIQPESTVVMEMLATIPTGASNDNTPHASFQINDGVKNIAIGLAPFDASNFSAGFAIAGSAFIGSAATDALARGDYFTFTMVKRGTQQVEFYIDGSLVQTVTYASLASAGTSPTNVRWGHFAAPATSPLLRVRQVSLFANTLTDYHAGRGSSGDVTSIGTPRELDVNIGGFFIGGDVDKQIIIRESATSNAQGGNNNGTFIIESVDSGEEVTLVGTNQFNATLETANPDRATVPETGYRFQFPDDLGKKIVISGSVLGNNGTFVIDKLLEEGSFTDLESFATPVPQKTTICEVVAGGFTSEVGLSWHLEPDFVTEAGLDWVMNEAGAIDPAPKVILRQALPATLDLAVVMDVLYSNVLSAQILLDANIANAVISDSPLQFSYYPFYLTDPLGFIRQFIDDLTVAGVIPDFELT